MSFHRLGTPILSLAALASAPAAQTAAPSLAPVDAQIDRWLDRELIVGAVAIVEHDGERVYERVAGLRDREAGAEMREDTIFRIYSMTKPVTCVAALILCEQGKLGLDDPVSKYLPSFAELEVGVEFVDDAGKKVLKRVPAEHEMTVRDLMRHTSGLTYGLFGESEVDKLYNRANPLSFDRDLESMVEVLSELPLKYQPGTTWEYGLSIDVLGRIIEVASGERLDAFMKQHLFEPLGMPDTGFFVPEDKLGRLAALYEPKGRDLVRTDEKLLGRRGKAPKLLSGGGGLFSTAGDYLRFARMLLRGGELDGTRVLREETVAEMATDQIEELRRGGMTAAALGGGGFGLGVAVTVQGDAPPPGTFGWGGAAGTIFWVDPKSRMVGVFLIQNWMQLAYAQGFQQAVYRALGQ